MYMSFSISNAFVHVICLSIVYEGGAGAIGTPIINALSIESQIDGQQSCGS